MRAELPAKPYVERVRLGVTDPRNGRKIQARGALAVSPNEAARLVLVGPGGTTAVDAWVTRDKYRVSIPALKVEKRGGADLSGTLGLPLGFLRWWFLAPLDGELLTVHEGALVLRSGGATFRVLRGRSRFVVVRREEGTLDGLEWYAASLAPSGGEHGRYIDAAHRIDVEITVEAVIDGAPDPAAFADPDSPEGQPL
jgi:hypothetical protein